MSQELDIFQSNDVDRLYTIAARLFRRRAFDYYLTAQQLAVLNQVFGLKGHERELFRALLQGKLYLKFIDAENAKEENNHKREKPHNDGHESKLDDDKSKDEVIVDVSLPEGVDSGRALALKVRYILWDKAIDLLYDEKNAEEYELFEPEDDGNTEQKSEVDKTTNVREVDEDDEYDDEDDDEGDGEKKTANSGAAPAEPTDELTVDESGNTVLEVPIVPTTETSQFDNKKLIENFNKIYHNFESDKDTLIKRRKLEENDKLLENDTSNPKDLISMNLGAANLSLKHLLRAIDDQKDRLQLQDNELRQLIMDVRKNRSKWASDDKIGQEELYEACEKVVMELRNYTEHSTAFLNKVSKREAPNYYQIIKKPMDLNTILKKLKGFQYKSKSEFMEDVLLIWKNCLTYNSDPRHFLRVHAIAMQKKSLQLLPLIPDITIRDRAEVEAEAHIDEPGTPVPHARTSSKKGKKRTRNGEIKDESKEETPAPTTTTNVETPAASTTTATTTNTTNAINTTTATAPNSTAALITNGVGVTSGTPTPAPNTSMINDATELEDDDNGETNEYLNTEDNDKDDLEIQTWKNFTSKTRSDFCIKRSELFRDNALNPDSDAILRDPKKLRNFESYLKHYSEARRHIFNPSAKTTDDDLYLIEYDIAGGLPALPYAGMSEEETDQYEAKLAEKVMQEGLKPSEFICTDGGLNGVINDNIHEMQQIRQICFKISLIRQMQQQTFLHHTQLRAPEIEKIDDSIDIDPVSRLENHEKMNKELMFYVMKKRVSKIAMQSGFEATEMFAIDCLSQIAGSFLDNLVKTMKQHIETPSQNQAQKKKNILTLSLLENGIIKPDELHHYVTESVLKQGTKLKDLKVKLQSFLKQLLRPAFEMTEKTFADDSEQFLSGEFSNELGDDFFGFKELGLDKEFGMLGGSIPLHLLQSRFAETNANDDSKGIKREEFESAPYPRVKQDQIELQIKLFQPILEECLQKTKVFNSKQYKTKKETSDYMANATDVVIMDDLDYPKKHSKPKLPPNGKITSSKKKILPTTFFLPEEDVPVVQSVPLTAAGDDNLANNTTVVNGTTPLMSDIAVDGITTPTIENF